MISPLLVLDYDGVVLILLEPFFFFGYTILKNCWMMIIYLIKYIGLYGALEVPRCMIGGCCCTR